LVINKIRVKEPKQGGLTVTDEPIWASNTGRSSTGKMIGDIVAWKTTISASWPPLSFLEAKTIRDAVIEAGPFFDIEYYDFSSASTVKKTVYAASIPRTLYSLADKCQKYKDITITFVEQ